MIKNLKYILVSSIFTSISVLVLISCKTSESSSLIVSIYTMEEVLKSENCVQMLVGTDLGE